MEGDSMVNVTLENDNRGTSCDKERVDGDKVEEHNVGGLGNEEVETPRAGMVFVSPEEVRNYYSKFAQREGFGIYRRSSRCRDDGKLNYFTLACARAGKRESTAKKKFSLRQSPKTNCKAKVNVALGSDGKFHLCHVILEHNHELSPGMFHSNRCKKSGGPRAQRRSKAKDPAEAIVHQDYPSLVGVATSCEIIPSVDSAVEGVNVTKQLANGDKHHLFPNTGHPTSESTLNHLKRRSSALENSQNSQDVFKLALAKKAVELVKSGMVIGLGTGGTSLVIEELGKLIGEGKLKDIVAVGANYHSRLLAKQFGLRTVDLNDVDNIDIVFDGVDEVDFNKNLLKGGEAAHTVQKVVYSMANVCIILAEHTKVVHRLGSKFPVAVEVLPLATSPVSRRLIALGGVPEIRSALRKDGPVITDLGNMIIDVSFPNGIQNPAELEKNINVIPGVVDNGIVSGVATSVLVAVRDGGHVNVMNLEEFVEVVLGWRYATSTL
ncbi:probable ribose-5-phosphate isomerase 3, chloroplastic isoform X3 [Quercus robur]|uniref:probable ribose-5-phosphate isomerase 3, chloroplastic isoform X3 n=1 Tax=Quercus robur TaxID=38942 RepID=UPI0021630179|nr:probable ribose-5-phosphate isomerase 3, chloroplastic isoform X3 [Quercus robur]